MNHMLYACEFETLFYTSRVLCLEKNNLLILDADD